MAYLIDVILPKEEIHLLAGPSGAGKTTWLFGMLDEWSKGNDVLGHKSHPEPWVYVAADRSIASVNRTLGSMGLALPLPPIPAWDRKMTYSQILDAVDGSGCKFAVIEAFGSFVDPPANSACVKAFLSSISYGARANGMTILGVVESPKMKPYEKYDNPRQRVSGAAAWGHFTETIFLVEPVNLSEPKSPERVLFVCPRQGPGERREGAFDAQNRLIFP
jgi:RecA-family ATPase